MSWPRSANLKMETEHLLIAAQNNAILTNYIETNIDNMQQNSKFWVCGEKYETVNKIISECIKLVQIDKPWHDWVGKLILSGVTTASQSRSGSNGNEGILHIPQSSSITKASPSDCLVPYPGHSLEESYPWSEIQSVYSTTPANWANG